MRPLHPQQRRHLSAPRDRRPACMHLVRLKQVQPRHPPGGHEKDLPLTRAHQLHQSLPVIIDRRWLPLHPHPVTPAHMPAPGEPERMCSKAMARRRAARISPDPLFSMCREGPPMEPGRPAILVPDHHTRRMCCIPLWLSTRSSGTVLPPEGPRRSMQCSRADIRKAPLSLWCTAWVRSVIASRFVTAGTDAMPSFSHRKRAARRPHRRP